MEAFWRCGGAKSTHSPQPALHVHFTRTWSAVAVAISSITKALADKLSAPSPWALSRVQRVASPLLILYQRHTEVLQDCRQKLRQFLTTGSLLFSNLSPHKMPICPLHLPATLPICLLHLPAAADILSYMFTEWFIFGTFYFILVFSAATVESIKQTLTDAAQERQSVQSHQA